MKQIITIVILIIVVVSAFYFWRAQNSYCANYILDENYLLFKREAAPYLEDGIMKSPYDDTKLELIVIEADDPDILDDPWRNAYYSKTDDTFWIAEMPGNFFQWFGPYDGHPCDR